MREHVRDAIAYLEELGATGIRVEPGGKHQRLRFVWQGEERVSTIALSPSDRRSMMQHRTQIRHQLGLVGGEKAVGEARDRRRPQRRRKVPAPPALTALPDWREPLRALLP